MDDIQTFAVTTCVFGLASMAWAWWQDWRESGRGY